MLINVVIPTGRGVVPKPVVRELFIEVVLIRESGLDVVIDSGVTPVALRGVLPVLLITVPMGAGAGSGVMVPGAGINELSEISLRELFTVGGTVPTVKAPRLTRLPRLLMLKTCTVVTATATLLDSLLSGSTLLASTMPTSM